MKYDLEERTLNFAKQIILITKAIKITLFNENIIKQLIKSSSSVGANYREANGASSKNDLVEKLIKETHELTLIFNKITYTLNKL